MGGYIDDFEDSVIDPLKWRDWIVDVTELNGYLQFYKLKNEGGTTDNSVYAVPTVGNCGLYASGALSPYLSTLTYPLGIRKLWDTMEQAVITSPIQADRQRKPRTPPGNIETLPIAGFFKTANLLQNTFVTKKGVTECSVTP